MNSERKINVHHSSLIGLQAELLKKQAEVKEAKEKQTFNVLKRKKVKVKPRQDNDKRKKLKSQKEINHNPSEDLETIKTYKKSKLMLQAKTKLYDQLSKSHLNMNPNFLVDFENKSDESNHSQDSIRNKDEDFNNPYDSDDEWAEYTDCFGRTRKCLREDLPKMKQEDELLKDKIVKKSEDETSEKQMYYEDRIPEREPEIEIMRRKWEEQTAKLVDKVDIHYQDILFDEARAHGVGYYAFSQDDEEREKQQQSLSNLRKETEQKQKQNKEVLDMKKRIEENKLKIARARQRSRAGLPPENEEEKSTHTSVLDFNTDSINQKDQKSITEQTSNLKEDIRQENDKKKLEDIEKKVKEYGDLLHKQNKWYVMSQEEWVEKKRVERPKKFAPSYDERGCYSKWQQPLDDSDDSDDSNIIGPLPSLTSHASLSSSISNENSDIIGPMPCSSAISTNDPANAQVKNEIEAGLRFLRDQFETKNS